MAEAELTSNSIGRGGRDSFVDILKGIGIISIVVGHSSPGVIPFLNFKIGTFVYGYHIMIFMFVMGFLFKKSEDLTPFKYVGKTVVGLGKLYFLYSVIFILLHNTFLKLNMISAIELPNADSIGVAILSALPFNSGETLMGAMWFVPMYIIAAIVFAILFYTAERSRCPMLLHALFIMVTMTVGIMMHNNPPYYLYHFQTSILAVPICYLGYITKRYWSTVSKCVTWYGGLICAVALYFLVTSHLGQIELAANMIIRPHLFYPATVLGIYYCLSLAKVLAAFRYTDSLFSYIGRNSFHIMALHFVAIKLVDIIYGAITKAAPEVVSGFPFAFNLWYIYYPIGVFLPLGIIELLKITKKYLLIGCTKLNSLLEQRLQIRRSR